MIKTHSVIILAAGKSSRMGEAKFSLKYNDKLTFIEKLIKTYQDFNCKEIIVVLNKEGLEVFKNLAIKNLKSVKIIENNHLEYERFYSIKLGLSDLELESSVFIQNSDNPLINNLLLNNLILNLDEYDYVNPYYNGKGGHPVLLSQKIVKSIITEKANDLNLKEYLKGFSQKKLQQKDKNVLININTPSEYIKCFKS